MSTLSPDQWQAVSPYLDQALDIPDEDREAWLAELGEQNPAVAAHLRTLLDEHRVLAQERYLEEGPVSLAGREVLSGQTIGAYTLLSPIGQGGMGTVWLAERSDGRFQRRVAVKFLTIGFAGGGERFKREGSIVGRLTHPHIAELLDAGVSSPGQSYLVLEYVEGDHIDRYCDQHKLDVEARVRLFLDVLEAVAYAHANLIVHRDIKPSNVLVRNDGQAKLLDFGIAKLLEGEGLRGAATLLTREGGGALTPEYAAPEQVTGGPMTTATDVYGLGVLLYVLLTGQHPAGPGPHSPASLVKAIVDTEPLRPSDVVASARLHADVVVANAARRATTPDKLRRSLRGDLETIVAKALKKNLEERYSSVTALADDLRRYLKHEPISAQPDTFAYRATKFVRRNRTGVALTAVAVIGVIAGVTGTLIQARTARRQRDFALHQLARADQINNLNRFLLIDPSSSGKALSVDKLLERAEHIVERENYADDPSSHVEMLISIGNHYEDKDEMSKAFPLLQQAYQLSRGLQDPSARAKASCALAPVLARQSQYARAEALIREGLRELPDDPEFALDRVFCLMRGHDVAGAGNDNMQEALEWDRSAERILESSAFASNRLRLNVSINLADDYRVIGRLRESLAAYERASVLITKLGYDETRDAADLFVSWGQGLMLAGRPYEAEKLYRKALDISQDGQPGDTTDAALLMLNADALRELRRLDEAAIYADRAYAKARSAQDQFMMDVCLLREARIYRDRHDFTRAATTLAEVETLYRRDMGAGDYGIASVASEQSLLAQATGDLSTALRLADEAVAIDETAIKAGKQGWSLLPVLLTRRSAVELGAGRMDRANVDARRALSLLQSLLGKDAFSAQIGQVYLALGRALQAQAKNDEARSAFRSAAEHLQKTLGPDHPDTHTASELLHLPSQRQ